MKLKYSIIAFIFISALGTVGHFLYEWTDKNMIIGYFFPVNESTWEHLKLLFFPTALFSVIEYSFVKNEIKNYVPAVTISKIIGMLFIVTAFYTYSGVLGFNVDFVNIAIYYLSVIVSLFVKSKIISKEKFSGTNCALISLIICFVISLLFILFTYSPPNIALFAEP